jgi:hypothetical protein
MNRNLKVLFQQQKEILFNTLLNEDFEEDFLCIVKKLDLQGFSKMEIYDLFLEFHKEIQLDSRTKDSELFYDRLSDFMDKII